MFTFNFKIISLFSGRIAYFGSIAKGNLNDIGKEVRESFSLLSRSFPMRKGRVISIYGKTAVINLSQFDRLTAKMNVTLFAPTYESSFKDIFSMTSSITGIRASIVDVRKNDSKINILSSFKKGAITKGWIVEAFVRVEPQRSVLEKEQ